MTTRPPPPSSSSSLSAELQVGSRVEVTAGAGMMRWSGTNPAFAAGKWVGVELFEPNGKNDGTVQGVTYFHCQPLHGVMVRPSQVKLIRPPPSASRPSSVASNNQSTSGSSSMGPPPPPTPRALSRTTSSRTSVSHSSASEPPLPPSQLRSPSPRKSSFATSSQSSRPPSSTFATHLPPSSVRATPLARKSSSSNTSSSTASPHLPPSTNKSTLASRQPSLQPATASRLAASRLKRSTSGNVLSSSPDTSSNTLPTFTSSRRSSAHPSPDKTSIPLPPSEPHSPPPRQAAPLPASIFFHPNESTTSTPAESPEPLAATAAPVVPPIRDHGYEEMKIRLRVLESKRTDEADKVRAMESKLREAEEVSSTVVVLQNKLATLQTELRHLRLSSKQLESSNAELELKLVELNDQLEMVTLDKEFAEEKGESLEAELEAEKEKVVGLEVEVEVLREENAEYDKPPDAASGERSSMAFIQLEKHNNRLKEALTRLRDLTSETEREQHSRIVELERDLSETSGLQAQHELLQSSLENAELQVEDLKIQLDDALGAEEMLELLTEKNLTMSEKLEEYRIAIEDLEALKDLNDELEENHVETEKQLQEEIDLREASCYQERKRAEELEETIQDHQSTISQFRALVINLQADMDSLREQHVNQLSETHTLSSQSQAVLNLNLKLQSSATKAQSKTIDLELRKLEASQATDHLGIVQTYLPQIYFETDADSTNCLLFFDRLAHKTALMNTILGQIHSLPDSLYVSPSDTLVGTCEMRGKLSHFSLLNRRFAAYLKRCSVEKYAKTGGIYHELAGVERRIDGYLELLKKDEFREFDCVADLTKFISQFEHLSETYFSNSAVDLGEKELDQVLGFDYDLDNFAAAVGFAKHAIVSATEDPDIYVSSGNATLEEAIFAPIQHILELVKSVKSASSKLVRRVEDLVRTSSALQPALQTSLQALVDDVSNAVDFAIQLAQQIGGYVEHVRTSKGTLELATILNFLAEITLDVTGEPESASWDLVAGFVAKLGQQAAAVLPAMMDPEKVLKSASPWTTRAEALKATALINVDAERKVIKLTEEVRDLHREIRKRDHHSQESTVRIQLLERRMAAAKQQADAVTELESDLTQAKKQERAYEEALEQLQGEFDKAEQDLIKVKQMVVTNEKQTVGSSFAVAVSGETVPVESSLETHQLVEQITSLSGALGYLRHENAFLKSQDFLSTLESLPPLACLPPLPRLLSPSALNPSDDEDNDEAQLVTPPSSPSSQHPSLRSIASETKTLYKEMAKFSASALVVDLSGLRAESRPASVQQRGGFTSGHHRKNGPRGHEAAPMELRHEEAARLAGLVEGLHMKVATVSSGKRY